MTIEIVDLPIEHGDFHSSVNLPEGSKWDLVTMEKKQLPQKLCGDGWKQLADACGPCHKLTISGGGLSPTSPKNVEDYHPIWM